MTDLATLGIAIDATQVLLGSSALDKFAASGATAEASVDSFGGAVGRATIPLATYQAAVDAGFSQRVLDQIKAVTDQTNNAASSSEIYAARAQALLATVDPYIRAQQKANGLLAEADLLFKENALSATGFATVVALVGNAFETTAGKISGTTQALTLETDALVKNAFTGISNAIGQLEKLKAAQDAINAQAGINSAFGIGVGPANSASASAKVIDEALKAQEAQVAATVKAEAEKTLAVDAGVKSRVKLTAQEFAEYQAISDAMRAQAAQNFKTQLDESFGFNTVSKSARDSAKAFEELLAIEETATVATVELGVVTEATGYKLKNAGIFAQEFGYAVKDILTGNTQLLTRELGSMAASQGLFNGLLSSGALITAAFLAPFALLITAMFQGEQESTKLNQAIAKTGNYAGATAGQVDEASKKIGASTDISVGKIRNQIAEVIGSGKYSLEAAEQMVKAADSFGEAYGINKEKVLKDFEDQKSGIVKWAVKHEEVYHDLTLQQIDYIDKLEKQGDHEKAQDALQTDILANVKKRNEELRKNYGFLENALHAVETAAGNMWDALLGIGRQETVEQKISNAQERLQVLSETLNSIEKQGGSNNRLEGLKQGILETQTELEALRHAKIIDDAKAKADAAAAQANDNAIRARYDNQDHKGPNSKVDNVGDNFQLSTDSINADAEATLKLAAAYSVSDAAVLQAEAHRKALTDATKKNVDQTLLDAREQANLSLAVANVVKSTDQNISNLDFQSKAQAKANDAVRSGSETSAQAQREMQAEIALRVINSAKTTEAVKAYNDLKTAIAANDNDAQTANILKQNEAAQTRISELKTEISLVGESNLQRAVTIAQLTEQNKQQQIAGKGVALTQDAKDAITYAGSVSELTNKLAALKLGQDTFAQSQEKIDNTLLATTNAFKTNQISLQQYTTDLVHIKQMQLDLAADKSGNWADALSASLHHLADTGKTTSQQLRTDFIAVFDNLKTGFAQSVGQAIASGQNIRQALVGVLQQAVGQVITDLILMGEQWVINKALGVTMATTTAAAQTAAQTAQTAAATASIATITGASVVSATATAAAWAPAAALVNAATFGGAATAGAAALVAIAAEAQLLSIPKLAGGGPISGPGGPKDDKVLVWASNGEFMVNAEATAKNRPLLEAINNNGSPSTGNHFANGGYVASGSIPSNDNVGSTHYHFEGADFTGTNPDEIKAAIFSAIAQSRAGIVNEAVQKSYVTNSKQQSRQKLNSKIGR